MLKQLALGSITAFLAAGVQAGELEVVLEMAKTNFIQGEPIVLTGKVRNVSGHTLGLALAEPDGFRGSFSLQRTNGRPRVDCRRETVDPLGVLVEEFAPGAEKSVVERVDCRDEPGEYVVRFVVSSGALYAERDRWGAGEGAELWSGVVQSAAKSIRIGVPAGEDLLAFDAFGGVPLSRPHDLLEMFPASTYAGYAILKGGPWGLDPVAEIEVRGSYIRAAQRDPAARAQMERLEETQRVLSEERVRLLDSYLEARPDFAYADFMRLELATRLAYLERYEEARSLCLALQRSAGGSTEARRARELLDYLTREGWIEVAGRDR